MNINYKAKEIFHRIKEQLFLLKYYSFSPKSFHGQIYVSMVDGKFYQGGMCDRFKGIISLYAYCKNRNLKFKINYTYPFQLSDYLLPNDYDWRLEEGEISHSIWNCRILYMVGEYMGRRLLNLKSKKQIHFYCNRNLLNVINNADNTNYVWGDLFHELFKPAPRLQQAISNLSNKWGGYSAAVFRFQNLLGDFPEYNFHPLSSDKEKEQLIDKCLKSIEMLFEKLKIEKLLVTSDSNTFLERASQIKNVFIIPGKVVHIGCVENQSYDVYLKSFVDFYMLANANAVYSLGTKDMYPTEFPLYAAKVNNVHFERILIK